MPLFLVTAVSGHGSVFLVTAQCFWSRLSVSGHGSSGHGSAFLVTAGHGSVFSVWAMLLFLVTDVSGQSHAAVFCHDCFCSGQYGCFCSGSMAVSVQGSMAVSSQGSMAVSGQGDTAVSGRPVKTHEPLSRWHLTQPLGFSKGK